MPSNPTPPVPPAADYVVVGAGSAGCAVAARLSADPSVTVTLLEAGGPDERPEIHRADAASVLSLLTADWRGEIDWGYVTEPEAGMDGRGIPVARGKVLGGCSSVNALMWVRGSRHDYDRWVAEGATGWSYEEVLPYFRAAESYSGGGSELRGADGPVRVRQLDHPSPLASAFVAAAGELGHDAASDGDYNGARQDGFGFLYQTNRDDAGRRCSAADAYLRPALDRPNLTVVTGARTTRLLLDGDRVTGVEYVLGGAPAQIRADREVIVSAGAFESPKLLRAHGIHCVRDLPGVGAGLQDHLFTPVCHQSLQEHPPEALLSEAGLFTHTPAADPAGPPDLQFTFGPVKFLPAGAPAEQWEGPGLTFAPIAVLPHSRGRVRLRDADPESNAVISAGYLSSAADLEVLVYGVELARELAATRAFDAFRGDELGPGKDITTPAELRDYVAANATTLWHPAGTCRMGTGPDAVTDPELRVHGIEGLRVADASVMPSIVAGNTHAPSVMIGERAAAFALGTSQPPLTAARPTEGMQHVHP